VKNACIVGASVLMGHPETALQTFARATPAAPPRLTNTRMCRPDARAHVAHNRATGVAGSLESRAATAVAALLRD